MPLPPFLRGASEFWRGQAPAPVTARVCRVRCYQAVKQCQTYWCWAAVLQELLRCLKAETHSQCELVEEEIDGECHCGAQAEPCDPTIVSDCNTTAPLDQIVTSKLSMPLRSHLPNELEVEALHASFCADRPLVAVFAKVQKLHYAVLSGLSSAGGKHWIEITDPAGEGSRTWASFSPGSSKLRHPNRKGYVLAHAIFLPQGVSP